MKFKNPLRFGARNSHRISGRGRSAAVAAGLVLVVGAVPLIGQSVSAATQDGFFQVQATDVDSGVKGLAGLKPSAKPADPGPTAPPETTAPEVPNEYTQPITYISRSSFSIYGFSGQTADIALYEVDKSGNRTELMTEKGFETYIGTTQFEAQASASQAEKNTTQFLSSHSYVLEVRLSGGSIFTKEVKIAELPKFNLGYPSAVRTILFDSYFSLDESSSAGITLDNGNLQGQFR